MFMYQLSLRISSTEINSVCFRPECSTAVWAIQTLCFRGSCSRCASSQCAPLCTRVCVCAVLIFIAGRKYLSICRYTSRVCSCQQHDEVGVCFLYGWKSVYIYIYIYHITQASFKAEIHIKSWRYLLFFSSYKTVSKSRTADLFLL